jgi:thermostable 8-oxoguanine DNA glycosylase
MIEPTTITNYNRTQAELEEFLMFAILVAGKTAKTQAQKLESFLRSSKFIGVSPFKWMRYSFDVSGHLTEQMKRHKLGQYNRLEKAFRGILQFEGRLDTVTLDELESVDGIGPKTARFFLLHSRPNQKVAALDTHILKFLAMMGYKVPKATPSNKKKYRKIELGFLAECERLEKDPATLDLQIWKAYSTGNTAFDLAYPELAEYMEHEL